MSASPSRWSRLWSAVRESLSDKPQDFTTGSLRKAIVLLAIPMVLEMSMQSVFELADVFFVAKLGHAAVAAVGLTGSLLVLVFAVGIGLSMAAAATVARREGEGDREGAARAAVQAVVLATLVAVPFSIIGVVYAADMLRLMGASPDVVEAGAGYCAVLFGTNGIILYLFLINAVFRGVGDAVLAMRVLWLANGLNVLLDPLFIFGIGPFPEWGTTGAAVATVIGRSVGVGLQLWLLFGGKGRLRIGREHLRLVGDTMRAMLKLASPAMVQYLVSTASWIVIYVLLADFGDAAVAGFTIAIRVFVVALLPSWGMGNAAATLVGQNLGAGKPERSERAVWIASGVNAVALGCVAVLFWLAAAPLVRLFSTDPAVVYYGARCLEIIAYTYVLFAYGMVTVQAFNGAGDTVTPTWINLLCYWVVQLPLAWLLAHPLGWGPTGIFTAIAIAQALLAVVSVLVFRRGGWKTKSV